MDIKGLGYPPFGKKPNYFPFFVVEGFPEKNYIFLNNKFSTTDLFEPTNSWDEVFEDQPVPAGLEIKMDIRTGKKMARQIEKMKAAEQSVPEPDVVFHEGPENMLKATVSKKKIKTQTLKQTENCPNCHLQTNSLEEHFKISPICKQV